LPRRPRASGRSPTRCAAPFTSTWPPSRTRSGGRPPRRRSACPRTPPSSTWTGCATKDCCRRSSGGSAAGPAPARAAPRSSTAGPTASSRSPCRNGAMTSPRTSWPRRFSEPAREPSSPALSARPLTTRGTGSARVRAPPGRSWRGWARPWPPRALSPGSRATRSCSRTARSTRWPGSTPRSSAGSTAGTCRGRPTASVARRCTPTSRRRPACAASGPGSPRPPHPPRLRHPPRQRSYVLIMRTSSPPPADSGSACGSDCVPLTG
jgi:hypothetical protein